VEKGYSGKAPERDLLGTLGGGPSREGQEKPRNQKRRIILTAYGFLDFDDRNPINITTYNKKKNGLTR